MVLLGLCLGVRTRYAGDFNVRWLDATVLQLELVTCRENSQKRMYTSLFEKYDLESKYSDCF